MISGSDGYEKQQAGGNKRSCQAHYEGKHKERYYD